MFCRASHSFADLVRTELADGSSRDRHRPPQVVDRDDDRSAREWRYRPAPPVPLVRTAVGSTTAKDRLPPMTDASTGRLEWPLRFWEPMKYGRPTVALKANVLCIHPPSTPASANPGSVPCRTRALGQRCLAGQGFIRSYDISYCGLKLLNLRGSRTLLPAAQSSFAAGAPPAEAQRSGLRPRGWYRRRRGNTYRWPDEPLR
jgi:hypothetical protein